MPSHDHVDAKSNAIRVVQPMTIKEAQRSAIVQRRPSYLQRYPGPNAPLQLIKTVGRLGPIGTWVLLNCGHWREIRDFNLLPHRGRKQPTRARCGLCREGILP